MSAINGYIWTAFENSLTPEPGLRVETQKILTAGVLGVLGICTGCLAGVEKVLTLTASFFYQKHSDPRKDFSAVVEDSRLWDKLGNIEQSLVNEPIAPPDFLLGTATCTYQDSGSVHCPHSQWVDWEKKIIKDPSNRSGKSANFIELYRTDPQQIVDRLRKLGVNSYRFSIEWSRIQPTGPNDFVETELQMLVNFCKYLRDAGIQPMITLHHFSEPDWFHKKGSFEKEENIDDFVRFAEKVFPDLTQTYQGKPLVEYFCTINEPNIEAFSRYVFATFSPGIRMNFFRAGSFMKGAFKAHCAVYERFKAMNPSVQVGIVHQYLRFIPKFFLMLPVTRYFTRLINETPLHYFKTGDFLLKMPFCHISEKGQGKPKTDFIALQYYTRPVAGFGSSSYGEPMTQMPFREDPAGLHEAIVKTHEASQAPIIVTENGISTHDDAQRSRYMARALYAMREAGKKIGWNNLRGYFTWCMGDNLEWNMGMRPQAFGAYALTKEGIAENPKPGMAPFIKAAKVWNRQAQQQKVA